MINVTYNDELKEEYQKLYDSMRRSPYAQMLSNDIARKIHARKDRYAAIAAKCNPNMPWWVVGLIHSLECGLSFDKHLHNGDPLHSKTTRVPAKRPLKGTPPFTFEESAHDALHLKGFDTWQDWSVPGILWLLESFNGLGYRQYHPHVKSPYLWSMTNHYTKGKYVRDGIFDENAGSKQLGCAAIILAILNKK